MSSSRVVVTTPIVSQRPVNKVVGGGVSVQKAQKPYTKEQLDNLVEGHEQTLYGQSNFWRQGLKEFTTKFNARFDKLEKRFDKLEELIANLKKITPLKIFTTPPMSKV